MYAFTAIWEPGRLLWPPLPRPSASFVSEARTLLFLVQATYRLALHVGFVLNMVTFDSGFVPMLAVVLVRSNV
jgi:hypothetical protein